MKKRRISKKSQVLGIVIFLIVIILILMTAVLTYVALRTKVISFNTNPSWNQPQIIKEPAKYDKKEELVCYYPFLKIGDTCCIDKNFNGICDNYEPEEKKPVLECYRPYIKRGEACCLDDDDNRICDRDESRRRSRDRFDSAYLNSPFDLSDVDINSKGDELTLEIKNEGSEDYIIKTIKVDDCDRITPDKTIAKGERKNFDFDCDFPRYIDSDIKIEYSKIGSNETLISEGRIKEDRDYYRYDYYDKYDYDKSYDEGYSY